MRPISYLILLFILFGIYGCSKDDPEEVQFVDFFSLTDNCRINYFENPPVIINNQSDYENYITCWEGSPPEIDFSVYTLLIARGNTPNDAAIISTSLSKNSKNKYTLMVEVYIGMLTIPGSWSVGLIIPKIKDSTEVVLDIVEAKHDI